MRLISCVLVAVVGLPLATVAHAQRQEGVPIGGGDIERMNPARVLLDRKKELKLGAPQLTALDSLRKLFDKDGKPLADSVNKSQRAISSAPPMLRRPPEGKPTTKKDSLSRAKLDSTNRIKRDKYFEQVTTGRRDLAATLLSLKDLFDSSVVKVTAVLTEEQRTGAALALGSTSETFIRRLRLANVR